MRFNGPKFKKINIIGSLSINLADRLGIFDIQIDPADYEIQFILEPQISLDSRSILILGLDEYETLNRIFHILFAGMDCVA